MQLPEAAVGRLQGVMQASPWRPPAGGDWTVVQTVKLEKTHHSLPPLLSSSSRPQQQRKQWQRRQRRRHKTSKCLVRQAYSTPGLQLAMDFPKLESDPHIPEDDDFTAEEQAEYRELCALRNWTTLVKLFILKEWARRCAFVVRWWDRRLPLGD